MLIIFKKKLYFIFKNINECGYKLLPTNNFIKWFIYYYTNSIFDYIIELIQRNCIKYKFQNKKTIFDNYKISLIFIFTK